MGRVELEAELDEGPLGRRVDGEEEESEPRPSAEVLEAAGSRQGKRRELLEAEPHIRSLVEVAEVAVEGTATSEAEEEVEDGHRTLKRVEAEQHQLEGGTAAGDEGQRSNFGEVERPNRYLSRTGKQQDEVS